MKPASVPMLEGWREMFVDNIRPLRRSDPADKSRRSDLISAHFLKERR
jgi:hypothetical protein